MAEKNVDIGGLPITKDNAGQSTPVIINTSPKEELPAGGRFISDELAPQTTNFDGDVVVGKNLYVDGKMKIAGEEIEGDLVVDGELQVKKDVTIGTSLDNADLDIYGNITTTGTGAIGSNLSVGGNLSVNGGITMNGGQLNAFATQGIFSTLYAYLGVDSARFGQAISEADFYENKNENVTLSEFSAYKVGQFVYLHVRCTTNNYDANDKIFDIKSGYKPKYTKYCYISSQTNWGGNSVILGSSETDGGKFYNTVSATGNPSNFLFDAIYEIASI